MSDKKNQSIAGRVMGSMIGFALGMPTSYFFQDEMIRQKMSLAKYLQMLLIDDGPLVNFFKMLGAGLRGLVSGSSNSGGTGYGLERIGSAFAGMGEAIENSMGMTLLFTVLICSIIGFFIGNFIDKTKALQTK